MYTPSKFWQNGGQWWNINCMRYMLPEKEMKLCMVRWSRCPGDWADSFEPFRGNCLLNKPRIATWKCRGWSNLALGQFFQNQCKKFLQRVLGILHKSQREHTRSIKAYDSFLLSFKILELPSISAFWQSDSWSEIILRQQGLGGKTSGAPI